MARCAVCGKKNERGKGPFFRVPMNETDLARWSKSCQIELRPKGYICIDHFLRADMVYLGTKFRLLPKALPLPLTTVAPNAGYIQPKDYNMIVHLLKTTNNADALESNPKIETSTFLHPPASTLPETKPLPEELINEALFDDKETEMRKDIFGHKIDGEVSSFCPSVQIKTEDGRISIFSASRATQTDCITPIAKSIQTDEASEYRINCGFVNVSKSGAEKYFNLRCFYCDAEYPITFWSEFSDHILYNHGHFEKAFDKNDDLESTTSDCNIFNDAEPTDKTTEAEKEEELAPINFINLDNIEQKETTKLSKKADNVITKNENGNNASQSSWSTYVHDTVQYLLVEKYAPDIDHNYSQNITYKSTNEEEDEAIDEITFGITPHAIVLDFLDHLKGFQSLWYNRNINSDRYDIELLSLTKIMNAKWPLNLRMDYLFANWEKIKTWFYKTKAEKENDKYSADQLMFNEYYEKCAEFLLYDQSSKFVCELCKQLFINLTYLQIHKYRHHRIGQLPFGCSKCYKRFSNLGSMLNHVKGHEALWEKEIKEKKEKELLKVLPNPLPEQTFKCYACNETFKCANEFKMHLDIHPKGDCPMVCEECGGRYRNNTQLNNHKKIHQPHKYQCELCPQKFSCGYKLNVHMNMHKGIHKYVCEWCGRTFFSRQHWRVHRQFVHMGYGLCKICNREYKKPSILHKHLKNIHRPLIGTIEDLYRCGRKGKRGPRGPRKNTGKANVNLRKYDYVIDPETQKRRLKCPICDKTFLRHRNVGLHALKIHNYDCRKMKRGGLGRPVRQKLLLTGNDCERGSVNNNDVDSQDINYPAATTAGVNEIEECSDIKFEISNGQSSNGNAGNVNETENDGNVTEILFEKLVGEITTKNNFSLQPPRNLLSTEDQFDDDDDKEGNALMMAKKDFERSSINFILNTDGTLIKISDFIPST